MRRKGLRKIPADLLKTRVKRKSLMVQIGLFLEIDSSLVFAKRGAGNHQSTVPSLEGDGLFCAKILARVKRLRVPVQVRRLKHCREARRKSPWAGVPRVHKYRRSIGFALGCPHSFLKPPAVRITKAAGQTPDI